MIARLRQPWLEGDVELAAMFTPPIDHSRLAPVVAAGRVALRGLPLDDALAAGVAAGLDVYAGPTARVDALVAWSEAHVEVEGYADDPDRYWGWRDDLAVVLRGLLPGATDRIVERAEELADAAQSIAGLTAHFRAGTVPGYLPRDGAGCEAAMTAELASWVEARRHVAVWLAARWDGSLR